MIKHLALILCVVLLLTSCNKVVDLEEEHLPENPVIEATSSPAAPLPVVFLPYNWGGMATESDKMVPFTSTRYTLHVPEYRVDDDLGNIANLDRFFGFSAEQKARLIENGFVVLDPNRDRAYSYMKMYDIYEENEYADIPNFVTVDTALHLYHRFFSETLKRIEREHLTEALQELTQSMLEKTKALYYDPAHAPLRQELEHILAYFAVANQLINGSYGDIPTESRTLAEKEIAAIEAAEGSQLSPLFGYSLNYTQFVVRGHYAGDEALTPYFKTMMWYGLTGYPFMSQGDYDYDSITKSILITCMIFMNREDSNDLSLWDTIYAPTNLFVGDSDDITPLQMRDVINQVYGREFDLKVLRDESYRPALVEALKALPQPQIQHRIISGLDVPVDKQFRFIGQRYTLDANILQNLMFPTIRPIPTGLDVAAALGNRRAEAIVEDMYLMALTPEEYTTELSKLKAKVNKLSIGDWQNNLYNGWLWVLQEVWREPDNSRLLPFFMRSQAWCDRVIQTGLGSYGELKHDTVLYAKQPAAEMGGGEEVALPYPNYVEPAVEVYDRLIWLVQYSRLTLNKRGLLNERTLDSLERLESLYTLLRDCSVKHLENIPLTEEENWSLKYIGGTMEFIDDGLADAYRQSISPAVISDVANFPDSGSFLEIGTGLPNEIFVALPWEGKVYLARGAVISYYEFISDKPMTDREWHHMLGVERIETDGWDYERINPDRLLKDAPPQPAWMNTFKSFEENRVHFSNIEYIVGE